MTISRPILRLCALAAMLAVANIASAAIILSLDVASPVISEGESTEIAIQVSGLVAGSALSLSFNPAVVSFVSETYGDPILGDQLDLDGFGPFTMTTPSPGAVGLFELSFDSVNSLNGLQADTFILATLRFDAANPGISALQLTVNQLSDAIGGTIPVESIVDSSIQVMPGQQVVPEPGTLMTLAFSMVALGLGRRFLVSRG